MDMDSKRLTSTVNPNTPARIKARIRQLRKQLAHKARIEKLLQEEERMFRQVHGFGKFD